MAAGNRTYLRCGGAKKHRNTLSRCEGDELDGFGSVDSDGIQCHDGHVVPVHPNNKSGKTSAVNETELQVTLYGI